MRPVVEFVVRHATVGVVVEGFEIP
jgi:hypothetical protein